MSSVHSTFPYELRIGVTGHRSASGVIVEEAVRKLFDRIAETLSAPTTPLSIVVISPLPRAPTASWLAWHWNVGTGSK